MRTLHADLTTAQQAATGTPYHSVRIRNRANTDSAAFLSPGLRLLANPDFELGDDGSWTLTPGSLGGEASIVTTDPDTGAYHLNLLKNSAGTQSTVRQDWTGVAALFGLIVTMTVRGKAISSPTTDLQLQITYLGSATGATVATFTTADNGGVYAAHSIASVAIPTDATGLRFFIATGSSGSGRWYADNVEISVSGFTGRVVGIRAAEGLYGGSLYNIAGPDDRTIPVALEIKVSNSDQALSPKDYRGYKCIIDWGYVTASGPRTSPGEPYWIVAQRNESREGELYTILTGMSAWQMLEYRKTIGESTGTAYVSTARVPRHSLLDILMVKQDTVLGDNGGVFTDESTDATDDGLDDVALLPADPQVNDALYVGDDVVFDAVSVWVSTAGAKGAQTITLVKEYYNGAAWVALTTEYDGIGDFTTAGLKTLKFTKPSNWATVAVNGITRYYMRWRVSAASGGAWTTAPLAARISIQDGWGFEISLSDGIEDTYSQTITTTYDTSVNSVLQTILDRTQSALVMTEFYFKLFDYDLTPATDYTYALSGGHTYYDSRFEQGLVIPNRVVATDLNPITGTFTWSGTANNAASQALVGIILKFVIDGGITSDAIAANVASRQLNRYVEQSFSGFLVAPMHCGQEPWDYIQVTDTRANKTWNGRVGHLVREWQADAGLYRIMLDLGLRKAPAVDYNLINRTAELSNIQPVAPIPAAPTDILFKKQQDKAKADEQKAREEAPPVPVRLPPPIIVQPPPPIVVPPPPIVAAPTPTDVPLPTPPLISQRSINIIASQALPGESLDETTARLRRGIHAQADTKDMTTDEIIARNDAILNAPKPKEPWWRRVF